MNTPHATLNKAPTKTVERVIKEEVKDGEDTVTLTLSLQDAANLKRVLGSIIGEGPLRETTSPIFYQLNALDLPEPLGKVLRCLEVE